MKVTHIKNIRDIHVVGKFDAVRVVSKFFQDFVWTKFSPSKLVVLPLGIPFFREVNPNKFSNLELNKTPLCIYAFLVLVIRDFDIGANLLVKISKVFDSSSAILDFALGLAMGIKSSGPFGVAPYTM